MRILLVASRYYPHRGGLETVVHHLAQEYRRAGHDVRIIANRYPRTLPAREVIAGLPVRRLQFLLPRCRYLRERRPDLFLAGLWYLFATTLALAGELRRFRPDVVNLHYLGTPGFFLRLLQPLTRCPLVVSLHGGDVDGEPLRGRFERHLFTSVTRQAAAVTACSRHLADQAEALAPGLSAKLRVLYNGVEVERFAAAAPYVHPRPYAAAVGQLAPHKGFDLLIDAFSDVAAEYPGVDLLLAGDGECRPALAQLIAQRGLQERIHLLGRVDEDRVASLMAGSLFVAVPSRREPFGIVALEALAAGKRVLATPVGGIPEFLPAGANALVPPERAAWARALAAWLAQPARPQDAAANQSAARQHTWQSVAERYWGVYGVAIGVERSERALATGPDSGTEG